MPNEEVPNELVLPVRGGWTSDPAANAKLKRTFRAIEEYQRVPHRVFGSHIISPLFYACDETNHAFSAPPSGTAFTGEGTDVYVGITIEINRRMTAFVWGEAEVDNTDAATDYDVMFFLPVDVGGSRGNGKMLRTRLPHGSPGRRTVSNIRRMNVNVTTKTTVKFEWGYKQTDASAQDITVYRQKMILALFDSPDISDPSANRWAVSSTNKNAYVLAEGDDS